jgi:flagellin
VARRYNFAAGAASGFSYTDTATKDQVLTAVAGAAGVTVGLGSGIYASTVTFGAAGTASTDTWMDSDGEMTKTGASFTTSYAVNAVNGEVTVAATTGTGKYAAEIGAVAYVNAGGKLTTDTTSKGAKTVDPLAALDKALAKVDSLRGSLGAVQNRFDSAISNLGTTVDQPVVVALAHRRRRLRGGSVEHDARPDPATSRYLGAVAGQPDHARRAVPPALIDTV